MKTLNLKLGQRMFYPTIKKGDVVNFGKKKEIVTEKKHYSFVFDYPEKSCFIGHYEETGKPLPKNEHLPPLMLEMESEEKYHLLSFRQNKGEKKIKEVVLCKNCNCEKLQNDRKRKRAQTGNHYGYCNEFKIKEKNET